MSVFTCESVARAALGEPSKREGAELLYRCPHPERHANGDAHPSLKVNSTKNIWACFVCDARGTAWQLAAFLARVDPGDKFAVSAWLRERGLLGANRGDTLQPKEKAKPPGEQFHEVTAFYYTPTLRNVRFEAAARNGDKPTKKFQWQRFENGKWIPGAGGQQKPLYMNSVLREADQVAYAVGFEGEAKCDLAGTLGIPGFSYKYLMPAECRKLADLTVILWPDADSPGENQAKGAARMLLESGQLSSISIITPPLELPLAGDIVDAVRALGWGGSEINKLIADAKPFQQPITDAAERKPGVVLRCFADIAPEPLKWLWPGRFPLGKLTLLIGDPGLGKSLVTIDLASRVTRGAALPDGAKCQAGDVILVSAEDDPADTIRPRLDAARADVSRVHILEAVRVTLADGAQNEKAFNLETDLAALEDALRHHPGVRLIVIDPISAYLGGVDSHSNAEVRGILAPLSSLAARHGIAIVAVTHLRKTAGAAIHRAIASIAFAAAARAVWAVAADPDDPARRLMLAVKQNLGPDRGGLAFHVEALEDLPLVAWEEGAVLLDANEVLGAFENGETRSALVQAKAWLSELLRDGPVLAERIKADARGADIAWATLRRAKDALSVIVEKDGYQGAWHWRVNDAQHADAQSRTSQVSPFEQGPAKEEHNDRCKHKDAQAPDASIFDTFGDEGEVRL